MSRTGTSTTEAWPDLPSKAWGDSLATLHMWCQVVGKVRLALAPPESHWWQIPLSVPPRGPWSTATTPLWRG